MPPAKRASGRRLANGSYRIAGHEISFDPDLDGLVDSSQPTPLFPEYRPPSPIPLSTKEKTQIAHFRAFRSKVHEGPYYTVLGDNVRIDKAAKTPAANRDPFEAMPTYSKKYTKNRLKLPRMNHRTYELKFFPKELWPILDRKAAKANGVLPGAKNGRLKPPRKRNLDGVAGVNKDMGAESDDAEPPVHEASNDEDDPTDDFDVDDEFEDDDGEGGDYNAEAYFDDGGDDGGDDYFDGDDGDGGDYF